MMRLVLSALVSVFILLAACNDARDIVETPPDELGKDGGEDDDEDLPDAGPQVVCPPPGVELVPPTVNPDGLSPLKDSQDVPRDSAVATSVIVQAAGACIAGVDGQSLDDSTVRLYRQSDATARPTDSLVAGTVNTSGGDDVINFQPTEILAAETWYRFEVTAAVKDKLGQAFVPFTMKFRTSKELRVPSDPRVRFQTPVTVFDGSKAAVGGNGKANCTLTIGPDGRLYAAGLDGVLRRWDIAVDGSLSNLQEWKGLEGRAVIGLAFDPAPERQGVLWISHNAPVYVQPAPDFSGQIARVAIDTSVAASIKVNANVAYITHLPRSAKDHLSNSLAFRPGTPKMYLVQGSNSAMGAPDASWDDRLERLLNASVLEIDTSRTSGWPFDVQTEGLDGKPYAGAYNPSAMDAVLRIYAQGVRNAYDLVWHSNGHLYTAANGSAAGGNTPASPAGVVPAVPAISKAPTQDDFLFDVVPGGYYGHPNPRAGHYVLNGGNPTAAQDFQEVVTVGANPGYPVGVLPDPAYSRANIAWVFGRNRSPNGSIEYVSETFGGLLKNRMLTVEFSGGDDILAFHFDADGKVIPEDVIVVARSLSDPLDLVEHPATGALFVTNLVREGRDGGQIILLRPCTASTQPGCN